MRVELHRGGVKELTAAQVLGRGGDTHLLVFGWGKSIRAQELQEDLTAAQVLVKGGTAAGGLFRDKC